jgi:CPA2 family monovalent cation:H+ antiporter-2
MSVFQDVTAVPFVVVIPILGATAGRVAPELAMALLKAAAAVALLLGVGRLVLRPLFRTVAGQRSAELFTLTVLLVSLVAAGVTYSLGLSLALGAFLAGMLLGDTEFRHQVEATIRPFRDVLLGLFFVTIGMLLDLAALPEIWHWALAGAVLLLLLKAAIVTAIVRRSTADLATAVRTGVVLAVGGEFGFALLALALGAGAIDAQPAQVLLTSVFFTMVAAPFAMRHADAIAALITRGTSPHAGPSLPSIGTEGSKLEGHVIVTGFGRVGQNVTRFLGDEGLRYVAFELDPTIVRDAQAAGLPVYYGDGSNGDLLDAAGVSRARLLVVTQADVASAEKVLDYVRHAAPKVPVMIRTRDEQHVAQLVQRGATEVVPETLEAALMIGAHVLLLAHVPADRVMRRLRLAQGARYRLFREHFLGDAPVDVPEHDRLDTVTLEPGSPVVGQLLEDVPLGAVRVREVVRGGRSLAGVEASASLEAGDVVVLAGPPLALEQAKNRLLGLARDSDAANRPQEAS